VSTVCLGLGFHHSSLLLHPLLCCFQRLSVAPESESKSYLRFSIPRNLEPEGVDGHAGANGAQAARRGADAADARLTVSEHYCIVQSGSRSRALALPPQGLPTMMLV